MLISKELLNMSRRVYTNLFGGSNTTTINPFNLNRNMTIDDLNMAIIENDEKKVLESIETANFSINQTLTRDPYRNTLLHTAIVMGNIKIIQKLLDMGADLKLKNRKGESAADLLAKSGLGDAVQYLADLADGNTKHVEEMKTELKLKDSKIKSLQDNIVILEGANNRLFKEKQDVEQEVTVLRKRKTELEETNAVLRQVTKKSKN